MGPWPGAGPKTVFLVNPASDNGGTGRRWPEIAHRAAAVGLIGDALFSQRPGHLVELAAEAAQRGAGRIVVVGGDGTVNEAVNGLVGHDGVELAVLPRGTGTDFVRSFGIPTDVERAARIAVEGHTRTIDAGKVTYRSWSGGDAVAYFANIASAGMSGAVAKRTNETTKVLGGKASYLLATLAVFAGWRNTELRITVDDAIRSGRMYDAIVANARYFGGGMKICPDADPAAGLFDVLLIGDITKADLLANLPKIYRGTHLPHPRAELLRGATVTVDAPEPLPVQIDGEQPGTTPARFEIVRDALRLRVPAA